MGLALVIRERTRPAFQVWELVGAYTIGTLCWPVIDRSIFRGYDLTICLAHLVIAGRAK